METMTTMPAVPAFLNLDMVAPPDLRDEARALIPEAVELAERVTALAVQALAIRERKEALESAAGLDGIDDHAQWLDPMTGWADVDNALAVIDGAVETVREGSVSDGCYEQSARGLGLAVLNLKEVE
jgi:hypothetical protein